MIRVVILLLTLWASVASAADAPQVVLATGQTPKVYAEGTYEGDLITLPANSNMIGLSLDRSKMDASTAGITTKVMCKKWNGVEFENCGAFTTKGGVLTSPFLPGKPVVNASLGKFSQVPSPKQEQIRIDYEITGGSIETSTAVQMWEVK